jgi:hypothetical protein
MSSSRQRAFAVLFVLTALLYATPAAAVLEYEHDLRAYALSATSVVRGNVTARTTIDAYHERLELKVVKVFAGDATAGSTHVVVSYPVTGQERLPSSVANDTDVIGFIVAENDTQKTKRLGAYRVMSSLTSINHSVEHDVETAVARAAQVKALLATDASDADLLALVIDAKGLDAAWNLAPKAEFGFNMGGYEDEVAQHVLNRLLEQNRFASAMQVLIRSEAIVVTNTKLQWKENELLAFGADTSNPAELRGAALNAATYVAGPKGATLPLVESLLKDENEEIRLQTVPVLDRICSWTPERPDVVRKARALVLSLWQSEKSGRVRLELLRTSSLRKLVSLPDDGRVYSFATLSRRGYLALRWGSVLEQRAVRVREAMLRDRVSNRVVQVLRTSKDGVEVDSQAELELPIAFDSAMRGSTVDLVLEGVLESAHHAPTSFSIPLGTRAVEAAWIKAEPNLSLATSSPFMPPSVRDAGTSAQSHDAGAVTLPNATTRSRAPAVVLGVVALFALLLGWAAHRNPRDPRSRKR